jgi:hypothetical protein
VFVEELRCALDDVEFGFQLANPPIRLTQRSGLRSSDSRDFTSINMVSLHSVMQAPITHPQVRSDRADSSTGAHQRDSADTELAG